MKDLIIIVKCGIWEDEHIGYITSSPAQAINYTTEHFAFNVATSDYDNVSWLELWHFDEKHPFAIIHFRSFPTKEKRLQRLHEDLMEAITKEVSNLEH